MFNNIDVFLINWFQYGVRQFELYTSINRKNLLNFFLFLMRFTIIITFLFAIITLLYGYDTYMPMLFLTASSTGIYLRIKKVVAHQKETDILPREIVYRKIDRLYAFFCCVFVSFVVLIVLILIFPVLYKINGDVNIINLITMAIIFSFPLLSCCAEYLLCTVSLPPGEKQKRKEEKEMKNMIPIPLGH